MNYLSVSLNLSSNYNEKELVSELDEKIALGLSKQILSVNWLAQQLYISERQLLRIVKRMHNKTTLEYVQDFKLKVAKEIIINNPRIPIKVLSHKLSFNDSKYFSKLFKNKFGNNPSAYK